MKMDLSNFRFSFFALSFILLLFTAFVTEAAGGGGDRDDLDIGDNLQELAELKSRAAEIAAKAYQQLREDELAQEILKVMLERKGVKVEAKKGAHRHVRGAVSEYRGKLEAKKWTGKDKTTWPMKAMKLKMYLYGIKRYRKEKDKWRMNGCIKIVNAIIKRFRKHGVDFPDIMPRWYSLFTTEAYEVGETTHTWTKPPHRFIYRGTFIYKGFWG